MATVVSLVLPSSLRTTHKGTPGTHPPRWGSQTDSWPRWCSPDTCRCRRPKRWRGTGEGSKCGDRRKWRWRAGYVWWRVPAPLEWRICRRLSTPPVGRGRKGREKRSELSLKLYNEEKWENQWKLILFYIDKEISLKLKHHLPITACFDYTVRVLEVNIFPYASLSITSNTSSSVLHIIFRQALNSLNTASDTHISHCLVRRVNCYTLDSVELLILHLVLSLEPNNRSRRNLWEGWGGGGVTAARREVIWGFRVRHKGNGAAHLVEAYWSWAALVVTFIKHTQNSGNHQILQHFISNLFTQSSQSPQQHGIISTETQTFLLTEAMQYIIIIIIFSYLLIRCRTKAFLEILSTSLDVCILTHFGSPVQIFSKATKENIGKTR